MSLLLSATVNYKTKKKTEKNSLVHDMVWYDMVLLKS